jgi:chorismate mutase
VRKNSVSGMSINELNAELRRRQRALPRLLAKRAKLAAQVSKLDAEIATLGGPAGTRGGGGKRPRNEAPLPDMLAKVMSKTKAIKVAELVKAVQEAGYKTTSDNFSTIVNQALIRENKRFKKASRGMYLLA